MTNRENIRIRKRKDDLIKQFGGKCVNCGTTENLQFAHIKETNLNGMGRGRKERYYDVLKNPNCYILLCGGESGRNGCHEAYDNGFIKIGENENGKC